MDLLTTDPDTSQVEVNLPEYRRDCIILDVREPDEFARGHVPGAINIPLGSIEKRIGELSKERKILAICLSGRRATVASGILKSKGYVVGIMKGGMRSWTGALEK